MIEGKQNIRFEISATVVTGSMHSIRRVRNLTADRQMVIKQLE